MNECLHETEPQANRQTNQPVDPQTDRQMDPHVDAVSADRIIRAISGNGAVRLLAARTTETVETARGHHDMHPTACAALGRLITGAALMSCTLKNPTDTLTLQIRSDGPIGGMIAVSDAAANVRGYAYHEDVDLPLNARGKLDVGGAVGQGTLHVIKDLGLKDPYIGSVPLVSGEIAEDLTWYHATSEQTPTVMTLGVLVDKDWRVRQAGGLFIQLMPDADDELVSRLEAIVADLPSMTTLLEAGETPESILMERFSALEPRLLDTRPVTYVCNCSEERMQRNLISLGRKELDELSEDPDGIDLECHFCSKTYHMSPENVRHLAEMASRP